MISFGLVGCGLHGERYLRHLGRELAGRARAVCVWRRDEDERRRLAAEYGVETVARFEELLERDDVDAYLIVTPPGLHEDELRRLLPRGKPLLVEKPVTATLAEADGLWRDFPALPRSALMVAQTLRYHPVLVQAREMVGELGELHRIRVQQRLEPTQLQWQQDAAMSGGGSVTLTGVHLYDLLRWFVGRTPDAVMGRALNVEGARTTNVFDACFEYEDRELLCATEVSKFANTRSCLLELVGTRAQLIVDYQEGWIDRIEGRSRTRLLEGGNPPTIPQLLESFCDSVERSLPMPVDFHDGRETLRMAAGVFASSREGRRIRLDEIAPENAPGPDPAERRST